MTKNRGFTLVELLVVVAIIAILSVIVAIAINPIETIKKTRDTNRISELSSLRKTIDMVVSSTTNKEAASIFLGTYGISTDPNSQKSDGTGWLKVDLSRFIAALPMDPIQKSDPAYAFEFKQENGFYELRIKLESDDKRKQIAGKDGGDDPDYFELGTNLTLL